MIEFLAMAVVAYYLAGNKDRRTASGQAVRSGGSAGRTAARGTWNRTRPARRTPSRWWNATPTRRAIRAGGRAARTGGHFGLAGLLAALSATYAAVRHGVLAWRETRREQIRQQTEQLIADRPDLFPESLPDTSADPLDPTGTAAPKPAADSTPEPTPESTTAPTTTPTTAPTTASATTPETAPQQATVTPLPVTTTPTKEIDMSTPAGEINDLTSHLHSLEEFYSELSEGEIWPVIESWIAGSDLFSRDLGTDVHSTTDEIAEAAQKMIDGREVILDAVETAILETKATIGDAA